MEDLFPQILYYGRIAVQIVVAFGIVIFLHELGHFLMAKAVGVGATEFALGMGPTLWGFQWGETYCKLCLFPIGGYVKLIGEDDEDVPLNLRHKSLRAKPTWAKIAVIFAGPFMNFVLAIVLLIGIVLVWGVSRTLPVTFSDLEKYLSENSTVVATYVVDPRKPAGQAGVHKDDTILAVNGKPVHSAAAYDQVIQDSKGRKVTLTIKRDYKTRRISFKPKKTVTRTPEQWLIGIEMEPVTDAVKIKNVRADSPAAKAGLKTGDVLVSMDGKALDSSGRLHALMQEGRDKPHTVKVRRGAETLSVAVTADHIKGEMQTTYEDGIFPSVPTPRQVKSVSPNSLVARAGIKAGDIILDFDQQEFARGAVYTAREDKTDLVVYRSGSEPRTVTLSTRPGQDIGLTLLPVNKHVGLGKAVALGFSHSGRLFTGFFEGIRMLFTREVSLDEISGPVGIMQYASTFAKNGFLDFVQFFAFISICLAVINLVPFPALDGAHIMFFLWEGISGRPLNPERQNLINYVGFCILIGLIIVVTFRDLRLWLGF